MSPENLPLLYFLSGIVSALIGVSLWHTLRFWIDVRVTRRQTEELARHASSPRADAAWDRVRACKRRLIYTPTPNPEWVAPLVKEVPQLVREIAEIYYPDHPEPLHAPKVSEFARAVQFASMDIAEILQSKRMGRLIDLSAGHTVRAWQQGQKVWKHPRMRRVRSAIGKIDPVYKAGRPIWQVARLKSPITWVTMASANVAVRTIQPAIINIIARRAIDLYSGKLGSADTLPSPVDPATANGAATATIDPAEPVPPSLKRNRLQRAARKLRFWKK